MTSVRSQHRSVLAAGCRFVKLSIAILPALLTLLITGCDYSDFLPDYDIPDITQSDLPFDPPDDWVPSDDGQSGFVITSAGPLTGPTAGGTRVTIEGRGFTSGARVMFGPTEGVETVIENEYSIKSASPGWAGYSETVDLWVVRADGKKTVLRPGFRYQSDVSVVSVEPPEGPVSGGTPITITGSGFAPDSDVIVDGRSALQVNRLDDTTILAVTPPGQAGEVEVLVLSGTASGRLGRAFSYVMSPADLSCSPSVVDMAGADGSRFVEILLTGTNLDKVRSISLSSGRVASMTGTDPGSLSLGADFTGITSGGPVDVTVAGPGGAITAKACFTALEAAAIDAPELRIWAVSPSSVPASGGTEATLTVTGLDIGNPLSLLARAGTTAASVTEVPDMNTVRFVVPAGSPGVVDVRLETPSETATLTRGLTFLKDATVTGVTPSTAPPGGGTDATVNGSGLTDATEVLVGPLPAVITGQPDDDSIPISIPAVGPGVHDLTVLFADGGRVVAPGALTCTSDTLVVKTITPVRGSLAGGTVVYVTGSGLRAGTRVFFDDYEAGVVTDSDPGRLTIRSPAGDQEGTVDVFVIGTDGVRHTLPDAFTYFNPTGFLGGAWGGEISGSVNVTVIDSYNEAPIPQAFVMIDSHPETPYKGFTDGRGMLTLSGRGLRGPVMVTATRQDYTTWSIAGVDAENITIYLEPLFNQIPPDTGNGGDDDEFPLTPGLITGRVTGTDKEFIMPPGTCDGMPLTHGTMCAPCDADADCDDDSLCVMTGSTAMTCSRPCAVSEDCPDGWDCYQAGDQGTVCKPSPGTEEVRCGVADSTSARWADNFGPGALMTSAGTYALNSRLGDVAVYCLGGFRRTADGVFIPVIMGLSRHVAVTTSTISAGNDVRLTIPLDRTLRLRMVAPPGGHGGPNVHISSLTIYLGSDGYLNIWPAIYGVDQAVFDFERLPARFDGVLDGAELYMSAEADSPNSSGDPYSLVYPKNWAPWTPQAFQILDDGIIESAGTAVVDALSACSSDFGGVVVDSSHRAWSIDHAGNISALPAIGSSDITACTWTPDDRVLFVGAQSRIYTFDPATMSVTTGRTGSESTLLGTAAACGDTIWVAGQGRMYASTGGGAWKRIQYGTPAPLSDLECLDDHTVVGAGPAGTLVTADADAGSTIVLPGVTVDLHSAIAVGGRLVVTGGRGTILSGPSPGELTAVATGLLDDLTVSAAMTDGRILVGGTRDIVAMLDGDTVTVIRKPGDQAEISAFVVDIIDGVPSGQPILTFRRASVMAGPFVNIPEFSSPPENWLWLDGTLSWKIDTPPAPSFYYLRLYTVGVTGRWSIIADGKVRSIVLPDVGLASGLGLKPLQPGVVSLWTYSVLSPGFDIDNYDSSNLYTSRWDAWSATGILTKMF